jgi:hypothetical protein
MAERFLIPSEDVFFHIMAACIYRNDLSTIVVAEQEQIPIHTSSRFATPI